MKLVITYCVYKKVDTNRVHCSVVVVVVSSSSIVVVVVPLGANRRRRRVFGKNIFFPSPPPPFFRPSLSDAVVVRYRFFPLNEFRDFITRTSSASNLLFPYIYVRTP